MTLQLDTRWFPTRDRAEVVREAIAGTIVKVEITFPVEEHPVDARGVIADVGPLTVCSIHSNATVVERTPRLARDDMEPSIFLGLQSKGSSLVVQQGRETVLRPGDLVLYDSTAPYTLVDGDGIRQHFFRVPLSRLALPHDTVRDVAATRLSPGHPVAELAATYLNRLASQPALFDAPGADAVGQPSIELIRAVITTHLDAAELGTAPLRGSLPLRILEYLRAHLGEPELSAAQVAAEHHISVRHLYNVLAESGISLGDWIRTHRLEACRADLGSPASQHRTIESVARRWGFVDMSSFSRAFRSAYQVSPREWRSLRQRDGG